MSFLIQSQAAGKAMNAFSKWLEMSNKSLKFVAALADRLETEASLANHFDKETQALIHEIAWYCSREKVTIEE